MKRTILETALCLALALVPGGCGTVQGKLDTDTGPHPATVEAGASADNFKVDHPEQFPVVEAGEHTAAPELDVTGTVSPDPSRQMPVPSLASGRIMEIDAQVGDVVKKGQLLFKVRSTDIAGAFSDYRKAVESEQLAIKNEQLAITTEQRAKTQLDRAQLLFDKGAKSKSDLEIAANNDDAAKVALEGAKSALKNARVDVETTTEHLKLLGADPDHSSGVVDVPAPASGVITDQTIAASSGVQALTPPNPFTISDISHVWIVCDVYENNMAQVHVGEYADIHLNAYPGRVFKGKISNVPPMVDPALRTAKVRLEVENPQGLMRFGMFVTATFHGATTENHAAIPANAILHLHDREWVYTPEENGSFRRVEVSAGNMLPGGMQEVISGIKPGDKVVANALVFQNTVEQK
jgi:cobalt-zinc-cadmium efflux system membrane fusion protein